MITRRRLKKLAEAQNWRCCYCAVVMQADDKEAPDAITRDHVEPKCRGGRANLENIVVACKRCNGNRGDMPATMFFDLVQRGWRPKTKAELKALAKARRQAVVAARLPAKPKKRFRVTEDRSVWVTA